MVQAFKIHLGGSIDFLQRFYLFIFRQRGREGEREREKHQCVVASHVPPTGDLAHSPACALCPDWELNQDPFIDLQARTQPLSHTSQGSIDFFS